MHPGPTQGRRAPTACTDVKTGGDSLDVSRKWGTNTPPDSLPYYDSCDPLRLFILRPLWLLQHTLLSHMDERTWAKGSPPGPGPTAWTRRDALPVQPFSQKSRTSTVAIEFQNRPLRPRGGPFGTLPQHLECGMFQRAAVRMCVFPVADDSLGGGPDTSYACSTCRQRPRSGQTTLRSPETLPASPHYFLSLKRIETPFRPS